MNIDNIKIKQIMNNFNFSKVHKVMTLIDWTWHDDGVPSIESLEITALRLLLEIINEKREGYISYSTGGFVVSKNINHESTLGYDLSLEFVLVSWEES